MNKSQLRVRHQNCNKDVSTFWNYLFTATDESNSTLDQASK